MDLTHGPRSSQPSAEDYASERTKRLEWNLPKERREILISAFDSLQSLTMIMGLLLEIHFIGIL
jgi:hypothetical protein